MFKGDRGAFFAIGLVAGIGLAMLFLLWAVPEFRNPTFAKEYYQKWQAGGADTQQQQPNDSHFWVRELYGWAYAEDSLAQWLMALLAGAATVFTIIAVRWARKAVHTSEAEVRAYFRVKEVKLQWEDAPFNQGFEVTVVWENYGKTPARDCTFWTDFAIVDAEAPDAPIASFVPERGEAIPITIGASATRSAGVCTVGGDDAGRVVQGSLKLLLYSAVEYSDVFGHRFAEETCEVMTFPKSDTSKFRMHAYPYHHRHRQIR